MGDFRRRRLRRRERWTRLVVLSGLAFAGVNWALGRDGAAAQTAPPAPPGAVQPSPPLDLAKPESLLRQPGSPLVIRESPSAEPPAEALTVEADVRDITLDGVSVFKPDELRPLYAKLIGNRVPVAEIYRAAQRIERRYRQSGFVLTRVIVPEQKVSDGRFVLRVVEGYVASVEVAGDPGSSRGLIERYLRHVTTRRPANVRDIERYLLLVNDLPGVYAEGVLTPDPGQTGAATLVAAVRRTPISGYATLDNKGSVFTGPVNAAFDAQLNGLGRFGGQAELLGFSTFNDEQNYTELSFAGHVGDEGARVRAYAAYGPSRPGASLRPLDLHDTSTLLGLGSDYPLLRSRRINLTLNAAFEATEDRVDTLGQGQSLDRQRILRFGALFTQSDAEGETSAGLTLHKGLPILNNSDNEDFTPQSRAGGTSVFFKVTGTLSRLQTLYADAGGSLALQAAFAGQATPDRLLSLEQFRVGGDSFGRGYIPGQLSGDDGLGTSLELQATHVLPFAAVPHVQLYGFGDYAAVKDHGAPTQDLASAGVGLRLDILQRYSADLTLADPFSRGRAEATGVSRGFHTFFRLTARY